MSKSDFCWKLIVVRSRINVFGIAGILAIWVSVVSARGGVTFTNLFSFSGTNGIEPEGRLLQAPDGFFYGTTRETTATSGGNWGFSAYGQGTIFRITTNGEFTTLTSFIKTNDTGGYPRAGLILGIDGNFYGTTAGGGATGQGTVFKFTTNGNLTTLASFGGTNGVAPVSALVQNSVGILYGTTSFGGTRKKGVPSSAVSGRGFFDYGTAFSINTNGALKTLVFFNGTNGANPYVGLIQGKDGNFYGSTDCAGLDDFVKTNFAGQGFGTVFKLSTNGRLTSLVVFNGTNGQNPSSIVQNGDGNLYGITSNGGGTNVVNPAGYDWPPFSGFGTVFKITPNGKLTTLVLFNGANGRHPNSFILGHDGNFYGTTAGGGAQNLGTIFKVTPNGKLTILYSFTGGSGSWPSLTSLMQGKDGNLYGTTSRCGKYQCGSVFRLSM